MNQAAGQSSSDADATLISGDSVIGKIAGMGRLAPGKTFAGRYQMLDRIGIDGTGLVYAAYDPERARKVALALLRPHGDDLVVRAARQVAEVSHPNILAVHEVGTVHDVVFVVMDLVDGGSLREWIDDGPHPWPLALELLRKIGSGLAAAHRAGLVHGDFEPEHVLLTHELDPRIARFGQACADQRHEVWAYQAPERHAGGPADARGDQFGFCVALYEALYGERPFEGRSIEAVLLAIDEGRIREPRGRTRVPAWLRRVVVRGLARDPAQRWPSMDALLDALAQAQSKRRRHVVVGVLALVVVLAGLAAIAGSINP